MNNYFDPGLWFAIAGGIIVKALTSPKSTLLRTVLSSIVAAIMALGFTSSTVRLFNLDPATFTVPIAIAWVFTGEGFARWGINLGPDKIIELITKIRGGTK